MPTLVGYKGLQIVSPDPTGAGGLAIQGDFKDLVDWHPKSVGAATTDPTTSDDEDSDFYPGSLWLRTNTTPPRLYVCKDSTAGAAVWAPVLLAVIQDSAPQLGGDLDVNAHKITSASNGNVVLDPNGTGVVELDANTFLTGAISVGTPTTPTSTCDFRGATSNWFGSACRWVGTGTGAHSYGIYVTTDGAWEFTDVDAGRTSMRVLTTGDTYLCPTAGLLSVGGATPVFLITARQTTTGDVGIGAKNDGLGTSTLYVVAGSNTGQIQQTSTSFDISSATQHRFYCNSVEYLQAATTGEVSLLTPVKHVQTYNDIVSATDGTTVTFNLSTSDMHTVTLGGNRTLAVSNAKVGQRFLVTLKQDGTGTRTVTWWNTITWVGGTPTLTTTPGKSDVFEFICTSSGQYFGKVWGQAL